VNCPSCNFDNPDGVKECLICGADMFPKPKILPPPPPVPAPPPQPGQSAKKQPAQQAPPPTMPQIQIPQYPKQRFVPPEQWGPDKSLNPFQEYYLPIGGIMIFFGAIVFLMSFLIETYLSWIIFCVGLIILGSGILVIVTNIGRKKR
jgi:hypothetical protein